MTKAYLQQYVDYVKNAGRAVKLDHFIEDWEPIGKALILDLVATGLLIVKDNVVCLPEEK